MRALALLLLLLPLTAAAQSPSISITVVERGTRRLLPGATASAFRGDEAYEAVSNEEGVAVFYDLTPGIWELQVELDGYFPFRSEETVAEGEVVEARYLLEAGRLSPYDVNVTASRPRKEVNRRTLDRAAIEKVPGGLGDPVRVVENLPGVARTPAGSGDIIVRGSGPQDTGVFVDGLQVPIIFHFGGLRSVIPPELVESVDFYPGNFSAFYGRFTGGALDVKLRAPGGDRLRGSIDVSLLDAALYLEAPITDTFAVAVAGRRSYVDAILSVAIPDDDDAALSLNSAPVYTDYQLLASWRPSAAHELTFALLGSSDELELFFNNPAALDVQLTSGEASNSTAFTRAQARWRYRVSDDVKNELYLAAGTDDTELRFGGLFYFDLGTDLVQVRDTIEWRLSDAVTLGAGFDGQYTVTAGEVRATRPPREGDGGFNTDLSPLETTVDDVEALNLAGYVEGTLTLHEHLVLIPSLRLDSFGQLGAVTVDPRVLVRSPLDDTVTLKAGAALTHQSPTLQELDPVFGNPDLEPVRAEQYAVGAEVKPLDGVSIDLTTFYKRIDNLVSSTGATIERDGRRVPAVYDNEGRGEVVGFEAFVSSQFDTGTRAFLSYTLSRAERVDSGATGARLFDFDQTHILSAVVLQQLPENWEIGARWRYVTGNPITPVTGGVFFSDLDEYAQTLGPTNADRLPAFHQLDLRVDKRWVYDEWTLSAYLNLTNVYNRANVEGTSYNFDFSEQETASGLPIYPIFGLKAEL